ncbi:TolB protein [Thermosulfidibacter takaii ABI70S6]|uniref:TolB protein n=1 Tax=Thermosulfidibacter takaii (strain DSM 17441 / JCM 13301 / NBRC 103674 / ABI70S6) TaxID=1298851 RepID=A0A0S3QVW4_THET7|nr:PD40 domain-containing protein [Thermosulfidibacter takaii]BAT72470.1 TolB protein [Thermosulfidibacter takaii ABI70S6]
MKKAFIISFVLALWCNLALGKIYVDITSPASAKIGVAIFYQGISIERFQRVLERDLFVYGIFALYFPQKYGMTKEEVKVAGADIALSIDQSMFMDKAKVAYSIEDLSDGSIISSGTVSFSLEDAQAAAHRIADALYKAVTGNEGMLERRAVAIRKVAGGYELVLIDVGAMSYKKLKFFRVPIQSPALSPDGQKIVFSMMDKKNFDIFLMDIATGQIKKICSTKGPDTAPSWMPDGKGIVFSGYVKEDNPDLLYCDLGSGKIVRLTRSIAIDTSPSVSPDGRNVAYVSNREGAPHVYLLDMQTRLSYRISSGSYDVSPAWSPRGDDIAYATILNGVFHIAIYNLRTYTTKVLFRGDDPTWSPNGDYILYTRPGGLYLAPVYGNPENEVRLFVGKWVNPSWR